MAPKVNNKPSDLFDSDNTPDFLTKDIKVEQSIKTEEKEELPSTEPTKSDDSTKVDGSSFGFFTPDSRIRSFSAGNSSKARTSRWNSGNSSRNSISFSNRYQFFS